MYSTELKTFLIVAETGSFSKAAEKTYISKNAVMKQINNLEQRLGVTLFIRNNKGLRLSKSGEVIFQAARHIVEYAESSLECARNLKENTIIRVGHSALNPSQLLFKAWEKIKTDFPGYQLNLVPYELYYTDAETLNKIFETQLDLVFTIQRPQAFMRNLKFTPLGAYRFECAIPQQHPLASKEKLEPEDLYGETLCIKHIYCQFTDIKTSIKTEHPQINVEEFPDLQTPNHLAIFNHCMEKNYIMPVASSWKNTHPMFVTRPINWNYAIPFGILAPFHPREYVETFIKILENNFPEELRLV